MAQTVQELEMIRLIGKRIVLRDYTLADCTDIFAWRNDKNTTIWMGRRYRQASTLEETRGSLARVVEKPPENAAFYAIANKETLAYVGGIDLTDIDPTDRNAALSVVIGRQVDRNKGYASEAISLLLGHAFRELNLHRISLNVDDKNKPALRCYLKNGFRIEGRLRDHVFINGEYCDLIQMGILESEYRTDANVTEASGSG